MRPCGLLDPLGGQSWAFCAMGGRELERPLGPSDPQVVAGAAADRSRQGFGEVASLLGRPVSAAQAMELLTAFANYSEFKSSERPAQRCLLPRAVVNVTARVARGRAGGDLRQSFL